MQEMPPKRGRAGQFKKGGAERERHQGNTTTNAGVNSLAKKPVDAGEASDGDGDAEMADLDNGPQQDENLPGSISLREQRLRKRRYFPRRAKS
jgi:hypothetical protein